MTRQRQGQWCRPLQLMAAVLLTGLTFGSMAAQEDSGTVVGRVTAEDSGNPISGVSVHILGTNRGTLTNQNGTYLIQQVPPGEHEIEFTFVSYATRTMDITVQAGQQTTADIQLDRDPLNLDEILVTGYGTARKEELTGSVVAIPAQELAQIPSTSFQDVMQGSPGVLVTSRDGAPGAGFNVRVRGIGSISAGSEPLYVIDGVPLYNDNDAIGMTGFDNNGRTANSLASLNPNDIESIVVLKDAASTAIYGSRGANGVVLITTKGGVAGSQIWSAEPQLEFSYQIGVSDFAHDNLLEGLNREEYHEYYIYARVADGMSAEDAEAQYQNQWPVQEDNNWMELMTQTGVTHQYDMSASGGGDNYTYYVSGSAFNQDGVVKESLFDRYASRVNLTAQLTDKFSLANNLSLSQTAQTGINDGSTWEAPFYMAVFMPSVLPLYDEEGEWYAKHTNVMGANHPLGGLYEQEKDRETTRIIDNISGRYAFDDRFSLGSVWSFDIYNVDEYTYDNPRFGDGRRSGGLFDESRGDVFTWQGSTTLTFSDLFRSVHNVETVVGYEASKTTRDRVNTWGEGFAHPELKTGASAAITQGFSDRVHYAFESYFGRANYDYDERYFLSASYRRDGSSRFGPDNRYGDFWSVGFGWTLTNEEFLDAVPAIDYLKLRTSYGQVGNADIGNYEWQGLYGFNREYFGLPGAGPSQVANSLLTWESQGAFNIGADYAILDNRIAGTIEYYQKESTDLLLNVPVSFTSGFRSTLQNFGDMENSGIEFSIRANFLDREDYDLAANFNITTQNNEITRLGEPFVDGTKRREEGRDYQEYFLLGWAGVDSETGGPLYYTDETKTEITPNLSEATRFYDGKSATPDYMGSFGLTGRFKRVSMSASANYVMGHYLYAGAERFFHGDGRYLPRATSRWAWENSWKQPGDEALFPQQIWGGNSGSQPSDSDRWLHQGDFMRLREVSLGYDVPQRWVAPTGMNKLNVHLRVNNAFTWTADENLFFDPEQSFNGIYQTGTPNYRTLSLGFTAGF